MTSEEYDEKRHLEEAGRLFGIRCQDGGVIACESSTQRDRLWGHMQKAGGRGGCRIPDERLHRHAADGNWIASAE